MKKSRNEYARKYLYCFIPLFALWIQILIVAISMYLDLLLLLCGLSFTVFLSLLVLYLKLVYTDWKHLKRPGKIAFFEKGEMFSNVLIWWLAMLISFSSTCVAVGMFLGY